MAVALLELCQVGAGKQNWVLDKSCICVLFFFFLCFVCLLVFFGSLCFQNIAVMIPLNFLEVS